MSARRWFGGALLLAALALTGWTGPARAQSIVARVGGNLAGRVGDTLNVPITVDLTGAPGVSLGSYRMTIRFNPTVLYSQPGSNGTFAMPSVNTDSASAGMLRMTAIQPSGAVGVVTLAVGHFVVLSNTGASDITISFDQMSGIAPAFADLLPLLASPVVNATFCHASGTWGDVDGDGQTNSRDALIALSRVVGIALDTAHIDPLSDTTIVTMRPGLADVDGDGQITSRDALIIMSYAVGLPVTGFRIGLAAAPSACGSGLGMTLAITPDTLELQTGQTANAVVTGRDSTGNPVSLSGATWSSGNTTVAGATSPGFGIEARDPGVAILTVQLGAGYRASMVVKVIAHRTQWYVDIQRSAQMPYEHLTGSQRLPFAFIQDALDMARDEDTVNVAPGVYPEAVSSDISVFLRGDSLSRPIIDPRGAQGYPEGPALSLGSRVGLLRIENFHVIAGRIEAYAAAFVGRNLLVDSVFGADASVYVYGAESSTPSGTLYRTPSVDLDGIEVRGFQDRGIWIEFADSVVIQNSTVQGDPTYPNDSDCRIEPGWYGGITIDQTSYSRLASNVVTDAKCAGIAVFQTSGQAVLSGNRVTGAAGAGILASAPHVALDHNAVRDVRSPNPDGVWDGRQSAGIHVSSLNSVDSVTSLADTVRNVGGSGFLVDTVRTGVLDSLVVDGTGITWGDVSPADYSHGAALYAGRYTVRYAKISNTREDGLSVCGPNAALFSQGNHVAGSGNYGITTRDCYTSEDGPDTLVSVRDMVEMPSGNEATGIYAEYGKYAGVDAAVVSGSGSNSAIGIQFGSVDATVIRDSKVSDVGSDGVYAWSGVRALFERDTILSVGGSGVYFENIDSTLLRDSKISGTFYEGVYMLGGTAALFERDMIASTGLDGWEGLYFDSPSLSDTIRVRQTVVMNSGSSGIGMSGAVIRADTIAVTGSGNVSSGLSFDYGSGGRVTGSRLERNSNYGVHVYATDPGVIVLSHNSLASNDSGGVRFSVVPPSWLWPDTLDASFNWWGVATGPVPVNDDTLTYGYITSDSASVVGPVNFANFLTVRPTFPLAPPATLARAFRPVASAVARGAAGSLEQRHQARDARHAGLAGATARPSHRPAVAAARQAPRPTAARQAPRPAAASARPHARAPLVTYRKGAPPRPVIVHHPQ